MTKKYNEVEVKDNMNVKEEVEATEEREEKKPFDSVVSSQPTKVKRSLFGRFVTGVAGPEGLPGIGSYVNEEIIKPAIKNIIVDAVTSGINMVMYGERGGGGNRGRHTPYSGASRQGGAYRPNTNYSSNYRSQPSDRQEQPERMAARAARIGVDEYVIADRFDAAQVLTSLTEYADRYDAVSVADYYDLIAVQPQFTDNNHGWTIDTITRASIVPVRGGYVIKFPPVEVI